MYGRAGSPPHALELLILEFDKLPEARVLEQELLLLPLAALHQALLLPLEVAHDLREEALEVRHLGRDVAVT